MRSLREVMTPTQADAELRIQCQWNGGASQVAHDHHRWLTGASGTCRWGNAETVRVVEQLHTAGADHVASIMFTVSPSGEYLEQIHKFAEEIMVPYRRDDGLAMDRMKAMAARPVSRTISETKVLEYSINRGRDEGDG
jgi:hypothetical protein